MYYTSRINPGVPPPLAKGFLTYIKELEKDASKEKYYDFFESFGTHFVNTIDFSARMTRTHQMSSSAFKEINKGAYSVEVTASYEGLFSVSGSASLSKDERSAVDTFRKNVRTSQSTLGALPNEEGNVENGLQRLKRCLHPFVTLLFLLTSFSQKRILKISKTLIMKRYDKIS